MRVLDIEGEVTDRGSLQERELKSSARDGEMPARHDCRPPLEFAACAATIGHSMVLRRRRLRYVSGMKLHDQKTAGIHLVRSYEPGRLQVGETVLHASCLITTDTLIDDWRPQRIDELTAQDLQAALALEPELVVLGSGPRQHFPAPELLAAVLGRGVGCEVMDTGAACRTYNILASEGRRVVAALML